MAACFPVHLLSRRKAAVHGKMIRSHVGGLREFEYREIRKATKNFDERLKLGQGGYGMVYRGVVVGDHTAPGGAGSAVDVAVKKFSRASTQGQNDFLAELSIINRLRHKHLVRLVGWSHHNGELLLVYEYMPNGSLDQHLFGPASGQLLGWEFRYSIIKDVASALHYLHDEYDQRVVHRDLKASNILLDAAFGARLGDFGLARAIETDKTSYSEEAGGGVHGTVGYIAPECFHTEKATRESDVYAFGAVVLEVVCGRRPRCDVEGFHFLVDWVWRLHRDGRALEAVDARLGGAFDAEQAERLILLGLACSHPTPAERPRTPAIQQFLIGPLPPPLAVPPLKPAFVWPATYNGLDLDTVSITAGTTTASQASLTLVSTWSGNFMKGSVRHAFEQEARQVHPDKNPNDPDATANFQALGEAYQVLSDPTQRQAYDFHGKSGISTEGIINPAAFFAMLFGSELFEDYIGQLAMASMVSLDNFGEDENIDARKLQERMQSVQKEWEEKLAEILKNRLHIYVQGNKEEFIQLAEAEVSKVSNAGAITLTQVQEDLRKLMSAEGHYTEEELEMYTEDLRKINVADIEATLSHVCQMVLQDNSARKDELQLRAKGLKTLGKIFQRIKLNPSEGQASQVRNIDNMDEDDGSSPDSSPKREAQFTPNQPHVPIMELNILERIIAGREEPSHLDLPLLYSVTGNFSDNKRIGKGGCGEVYKGILQNADIAVKRLFNSRTIKDKMFHREVKSLITVRHQNIVRFLGYCSFTEERAIPVEGQTVMVEIRERLLCFEYISNGSLERHITDELRGLEWHTRLDIIMGICKGLCYLHKEKNITHMDLKPSNILLDDDMVPKITDFGLSRLDNNPQAATTSRLISPGYSAPEYLSEGKSSKKSDIYSLGVIILEMVSGSKNNPNITKVLRKWRHRWIKSSKHTPLGYHQVTKCIDLAHRCMERDRPADRPDISDILQELNEIDSNDDQFQVIPSLEDMLGIEPLEIQFPFELYWQVSHTVELSNDTDDHFAFGTKPSFRLLRTEPDKGIVPPRSKCSVTVTMMQAQVIALPNNRYKEDITVLSTRVDGGLAAVDITKDMFIEEGNKVVDEVNVMVVLGRPPLEGES